MIRSITFVTAAALAVSTPAFAQHQHEPVAQTEPRHQHEPAPAPAPQPAPHDPSMHQGMDHAEHGMDHEQHMMGAAMTGVLGPYGMSRDASGTAWQPDVSEHGGIHSMHGEWMVMSHLMLNGVYDWQDGPRGDDRAFLAGMIMGSARRDI